MARKTYDEYKIASAKLIRDQGYTIEEAAEGFRGLPGSIRSWVSSYVPAFSPPAPDASPEQLHREINRLREEDRRVLM